MQPARPIQPVQLPVRDVGTIRDAHHLEAFLLAVDIAQIRPQAEAAGALLARMVWTRTDSRGGVA